MGTRRAFLAFLLISCVYFSPSHAEVLKIFGIFPLHKPSAFEQPYLAQLAVDEINANPDILPDTTLEFIYDSSHLDDGVGLIHTLEALQEHGDDIVAIMGSALSSVSMAVSFMSKYYAVPQISHASTNTELSDKQRYPFFSRVIPHDALQGVALANVVENFGWKKVATLCTNDAYGSEGIAVFQAEAAKKGIEIISYQSFNRFGTDVRQQLQAIKASNVRVIVANMYGPDMVTVLRQAKELGMTSKGWAWVGSESTVSDYPTILSTEPDLASAYAGVINVFPGSGQRYGEFYEKWKTDHVNTQKECPTSTCAIDGPWIARADLASLYVYAPFAYDAAYLIAHALHQMKLDGKDVKDGELLHQQIGATSFEGITGPIVLDENHDRLGAYDVKNCLNGENSVVGSWSPTEGIKMESTVYFSGGVTDVPSDVPSFTLREVEAGLRLGMWVLSGLTILLALIFIAIIMTFRHHFIIKAASPVFCVLICVGAAITCGSVFALGVRSNDASCVLVPSLLATGFSIMFGSLFVKTYRVWKIFDNKRLKQLQLANGDLLRAVLVLLALDGIIIGVFSGVDPLKVVEVVTKGEDLKQHLECHSSSLAFVAVMIAYKGILLILGVILAYQTRGVIERFNESRKIGLAIYNMFSLGAIAIALSFLLQGSPDAVFLIESAIIVIVSLFTLLVLFIPKFAVIRSGRTDASFAQSKMQSGSGAHGDTLATRVGP